MTSSDTIMLKVSMRYFKNNFSKLFKAIFLKAIFLKAILKQIFTEVKSELRPIRFLRINELCLKGFIGIGFN